MANETVSRRYAAAVYDLAKERDSVERVGSDLASVQHALFSEPLSRQFFVAPVIDRTEKERVLGEVFTGRLDPVALNTILLLVRKRRGALLPEIVAQYQKLALESQGAEPLSVTSARALSDRELSALVTRVQRVYKRKFHVTQRVDPALIGGMRLMLGDRRIDGSVSGRLDQLARTLFGPKQ